MAMSWENVEVVRQLHFGPEVDIARLFRDEQAARALGERLAPFFSSEFRAVAKTSLGETSGTGLGGLREVWLDWLEPWEGYRTEVEDIIDTGESVPLRLP